MFRFFACKYVPLVVPVVGVVCIGKYLQEEIHNQQKYCSSRRCPMITNVSQTLTKTQRHPV